MSRRHALAALAATAALLGGGCGGAALRWEPDIHTVRRGETLYSIAFRYRLDHRSLAVWNGIDDPGLIFAGQRLRLTPPPESPGPRQPRDDTVAGAVAAPRAPPQPSPAPQSAPPPVRRPAPTPEPVWQWPASGELLARFGDDGALGRGIDIGGRVGDNVRAAAAGRVVYSGSGLLGYGNLIILKHNEMYLSAYGHNETLLVREGDAVGAGQRIARMGHGPGDRAVLHFELRIDGQPVDPLQYLPER